MHWLDQLNSIQQIFEIKSNNFVHFLTLIPDHFPLSLLPQVQQTGEHWWVLLDTWQGQGFLSLGHSGLPQGSVPPWARTWPSQNPGTPQWVRGISGSLLNRESESMRRGSSCSSSTACALFLEVSASGADKENYTRSKWKTFICTWETKASVSVSCYCHKNTHAFTNASWWFWVWSVPWSDVPHGHTKAWMSKPRGIVTLKREDKAKWGRLVFMTTLLP